MTALSRDSNSSNLSAAEAESIDLFYQLCDLDDDDLLIVVEEMVGQDEPETRTEATTQS